jgi:hypothetical protein
MISGPSPSWGAGTYVEINNLHKQRDNHEDQQEVEEPVIELRRASNLGNNGSTETLRAHDTRCPSARDPQDGRSNSPETSDQGANGQIHHHALIAVLGCYEHNDADAAHDDHSRITQKPG